MTDFLFSKNGNIIIAVFILIAFVLLSLMNYKSTYESKGVLSYENGDVICYGTRHWKKRNPSFFKFECEDGKIIRFE